MNIPLVSIVVPVYNVAEYLPRCVDSLLAQDYPNIEIILVDDGSTDNSFEVCCRYESEKVRVFTKPNGGPASARNFGIEHCSSDSEYLAFVDSDDTVVQKYVSAMISHNEDLVVSSLMHIYNESAGGVIQSAGSECYDNLRTNSGFVRLFENGIMNSPWNKLFKFSIIREFNLRFKDIKTLEDIDFVFKYLKHCACVRFIPAPLYNYIHRFGSESKRVSTDIYDNYMILHQEMLDWFDKSLEPGINRFVYPQYLAVTLRFMREGDFTSPMPYLKKALVRKAFASHKCSSPAEFVMHTMVRLRMLRLAKRMFLR